MNILEKIKQILTSEPFNYVPEGSHATQGARGAFPLVRWSMKFRDSAVSITSVIHIVKQDNNTEKLKLLLTKIPDFETYYMGRVDTAIITHQFISSILIDIDEDFPWKTLNRLKELKGNFLLYDYYAKMNDTYDQKEVLSFLEYMLKVYTFNDPVKKQTFRTGFIN